MKNNNNINNNNNNNKDNNNINNNNKEIKSTHRLLYYEKPAVGPITRTKTITTTPIQIIHSTGEFGIALPLQQERIDINTNSLYIRGDAMVISSPESSLLDDQIRRKLIYCFIFVAFINLLITILLYSFAHEVDLSKVMPSSIAPNSFAFVQIPKTRRYSEKLIFAITILNLLFGILGAIIQNPTILFLYSIILLLVFFFGYPVIPYMLYSIRYVIDAVNLYVAYSLRSRLMINTLPFYFVRR